jgi:multiple sugar transport system permease protein
MGEARHPTSDATGLGRRGPDGEVRAAAGPESGTSRFYRLRNSEAVLAVVCVGPAVLVLAVILAYPVAYELGLSFYRRNLINPDLGTQFVGLQNFIWLFGTSDLFRIAVLHSVMFAVGDVILELSAGLCLAMLLQTSFRGVSILRGLAILPWAIPAVVVAFIFRAILSPEYGLVNQIIRAILSVVTGQPSGFEFDWLSQPASTFVATLLVLVWKGFPFVFLVLLAGLQGLPVDISQAAKVDGATWWGELRFVTLPLLKPVIIIVAILRSISTFNQFDLVWLLTGQGPLNSTLVLSTLVYNEAFVIFDVGRAAAITAFMFIVLAFLTFFFLSLDREGVPE